MPDSSLVIYAHAHYRIVRRAEDAAHPYIVVDTAGSELRRERNLDDAKAWISRLEADAKPRALPPARRSRR